MYPINCGRFYVAGEPCSLKSGWYSLRPLDGARKSKAKAKAMRPTGRPDLDLYALPPCRSRRAGDGGLIANQSLTDVLNPLWEPACWRRRPDSQPISRGCTRSTVGAGLPAKAPQQPERISQLINPRQNAHAANRTAQYLNRKRPSKIHDQLISSRNEAPCR
jgi:hypothetical protein